MRILMPSWIPGNTNNESSHFAADAGEPPEQDYAPERVKQVLQRAQRVLRDLLGPLAGPGEESWRHPGQQIWGINMFNNWNPEPKRKQWGFGQFCRGKLNWHDSKFVWYLAALGRPVLTLLAWCHLVPLPRTFKLPSRSFCFGGAPSQRDPSPTRGVSSIVATILLRWN